MKLNVGCAEYYCDGWVNIDIAEDDGEKGIGRRPDILAPAWELPFDDDEVDRIYCGHMLEHVSVERAQASVKEFMRVLKPGGEMMVLGPDVVLEAEFVFKGGRDRGAMWGYPTDAFDSEFLQRPDWNLWILFWSVHASSGVGTMYPKDFVFGPGYKHQWNCTLEALELMTRAAGFDVLDASYDAFTRWEKRAEEDWEPIVSGADGQAYVIGQKPCNGKSVLAERIPELGAGSVES